MQYGARLPQAKPSPTKQSAQDKAKPKKIICSLKNKSSALGYTERSPHETQKASLGFNGFPQSIQYFVGFLGRFGRAFLARLALGRLRGRRWGKPLLLTTSAITAAAKMPSIIAIRYNGNSPSSSSGGGNEGDNGEGFSKIVRIAVDFVVFSPPLAVTTMV